MHTGATVFGNERLSYRAAAWSDKSYPEANILLRRLDLRLDQHFIFANAQDSG
jgi:hypothetical protein